MRAIVVEDEPLAAQELCKLLAEYAPDLDVEGPYTSVASTLERLRRPPEPDLLFMDVQLDDGLCFELFDAMSVSTPVIFTTAFDRFAIKAFEVFGIDYLLKPIRPERLALALGKWRRLVAGGTRVSDPPRSLTDAYLSAAQRFRTRFLVHHGDSVASVASEDVAYFCKELVVRLVTKNNEKYTLSHSLDELERVVDPNQFFRANRRMLVRFSSIVAASRAFKGKLILEVRPPVSGEPVVISQERAAAFRDWLDR